MKFKKSISFLTIIIIVLSLVASIYGIFSKSGQGNFEFKSLHGNTILIYGMGLYKNESVSMATQAKAQDIVTLCIGIPILIVTIYLARKGSLKWRLLLTGMFGYFLYTYFTYTFYAMYNPLYLVYIAIMSASFFAFVLTMVGFNLKEMKSRFNPQLPVKFIGGVLIFISIAVALMWIGKIAPPLMIGSIPTELEHYTTLVIQAIDLGFLLPSGILAGILIIKRNAFGYVLASVIIINEAALLTLIISVLIGQILAGIQVGASELIMFPLLALVVVYCMYLIMKNVKEPRYS